MNIRKGKLWIREGEIWIGTFGIFFSRNIKGIETRNGTFRGWTR